MDDAIDTTDDTAADVTGEQSTMPASPPVASDAFTNAMSLVALAENTREFKKRLRSLHDAQATTAADQLKLAADKAAHKAKCRARQARGCGFGSRDCGRRTRCSL